MRAGQCALPAWALRLAFGFVDRAASWVLLVWAVFCPRVFDWKKWTLISALQSSMLKIDNIHLICAGAILRSVPRNYYKYLVPYYPAAS